MYEDSNAVAWSVCEDLQQLDGAMLLISSQGARHVFSKTYQPYEATSHYLNVSYQPKGSNKHVFGKAAVSQANFDILGEHLLSSNYSHLTLELVKSALPPLDGVGTFVGSRSASVDTVLGKFAEDLDNYGFPNV